MSLSFIIHVYYLRIFENAETDSEVLRELWRSTMYSEVSDEDFFNKIIKKID